MSKCAGHQISVESWGTRLVVSCIPRIPDGGTHLSSQAAFGNMCRGSRMFAPTKIWRRWHHKVNVNLKCYDVVLAIAASAVPSFILTLVHRIESIIELSLVISDLSENIEKTWTTLEVDVCFNEYSQAHKSFAI
jgi:large subunit ribosomal protein L4e